MSWSACVLGRTERYTRCWRHYRSQTRNRLAWSISGSGCL